MANIQQIISAFTAVYSNIGSYILSSSKTEHLVDTSGGYTIFSSSGIEQGFDVVNPNNIDFKMIQIDNKLFVGQKGGQCDCAFFYDNDFNFVEFKTSAFSPKNVLKNYTKAEKQIRNTVKMLKSDGIDVRSLATHVSAYICFNNSYPRKKASEMNRSILFASDNDTKGIGLYFENNKTI